MTFITIKAVHFYNKPEFYSYMSPTIFDALESAVLSSTARWDEITADVPESDFLKMVFLTSINSKPQQN